MASRFLMRLSYHLAMGVSFDVPVCPIASDIEISAERERDANSRRHKTAQVMLTAAINGIDPNSQAVAASAK